MKMNYENTKKSIRLENIYEKPRMDISFPTRWSSFTCLFVPVFFSVFFFFTQKNKKIKWKREPKLHRQNNKYETVVTGLV
jgi:hypothetical protein